MRGKSWPNDEVRQLHSLLEAGKSLDEIAAILGKTRVAIRAKMFNLGLKWSVDATVVGGGVAAAAAAASSPGASDSSVVVPVSVSTPVLEPVRVVKVEGVDLRLPERLPSVEEELKVLSAAVEALKQAGLGRAEVARLRSIILGVKTYQELYAKYVGYRELELQVLELKRKFASQNTQASGEGSSGASY